MQLEEALGYSLEGGPFALGLLSLFVGFYVASRVGSSFHAPLMGLTNAISSIVIFIALGALNLLEVDGPAWLVWLTRFATFLLSINVFGGLVLTWKMLKMFFVRTK